MTDLLYSDVEESLRSSLRSSTARALRGHTVAALYDRPDTDVSGLWRTIATELGLAGLLIPEELGGAGAGAREAAVVLEELGRSVAPVPYLTSAVIATSVLVAARDGERLARLVDDAAIAVLAVPWSSRRGSWAPTVGAVEPVAGAIGADVVLVPVDVGGTVEVRAFSRDEVEVEPLTSLDMSRPLARVRPRGPGETLLSGRPAVEAVDSALAAGAALLASEQYGLAAWCLETTVDYAKTRIQFARPIGSFQAIKHRLADAFVEVVQAQAAARYAADTMARDDADQHIAQAVAQAYCSDVAVHLAEEALQLHGGIGMTWEHPVHLFLKRAKSDQLALGTPSRHRADLGALVDLTL